MFLYGDTFGNLFIADTYNRKVRLVSTSTGIITTLAGSGVSDYTGDGGQVYFNRPEFKCLFLKQNINRKITLEMKFNSV
jgi:hypothetical protein